MPEPEQEYARRAQARRQARVECDRRRFALGMARLAVFAAGAVIFSAALFGRLSFAWLLLPTVAFAALGVRLTALELEGAGLDRAEDFYRRGLARLQGRWAGAGEGGRRFLDDEHLYARDLDLFGSGSLFELLCQARTRVGEETLAAWLLKSAPAAEVRRRQEAVRELAPMLDFRERVAVLGETAREGVHAERLAAWGERARVLTSRRFLWVARALTVVGAGIIVAALLVAAAVMAAANGNPAYLAWASAPVRAYFLGAVLLLGAIGWRFNTRAETIFHGAEEAADDVGLLAGVLRQVEEETFTAPRLEALRADLDIEGEPPSVRIARLERLMEFVLQRDNMLVRLIGPLLFWDVHLAYALEDWRAASGSGMRRWLRAVGDVEALSSMAAYHHERPDDVFPEISDTDSVPLIEATALAHPLLPADSVVANDVAVGGTGPAVLVVSGSNMSGKSTLLRTLGVAAVLAQAGAPVRAARVRMTPLAVGASIRVTDSLQEGESRFYAEILRLGDIVARAEAEPSVLFLIDEFLHGTNSHDRRIGAAAIVRGLVNRGAIGLVTTHDLALTHIADDLGARGANVHFEDHLEGGRMTFDYRLRAGVVEKSNALELMRSVGLDVDRLTRAHVADAATEAGTREPNRRQAEADIE
jgi:hypothetical protein